MPEHVLTHPNLPDQPYTVEVADGQELSPEYERAGWVDQGAPPEPAPEEAADEDDPDAPGEVTPPPEQADNPLDLTKEN